MASLLSSSLLRSGPKLGNVSPSSLIRSAATLVNQINANKDESARIQYNNSAKTSSDLQTYTDYLNGRINQLNTAGSITDSTKAMQLGQTIISATHANISADIARENISIMTGNATLTDKYNTIATEYTRAVNIGDMALAQQLEGQAYSVSQSIQLQNQTSAAATTTLAKATGASEGQVVTNLTDAVKQLNTDIKTNGMADAQSTINNWVTTNAPQLKELGVIIPTGSTPNYWDLVNAVMGAQYTANTLASQAYAPYDAQTSLNYQNKATNLLIGATTIQTLAGDKTPQEVQAAAQNPNMYAYDNTTGTFKLTTQTGYSYQNFTNEAGQAYTALAPTYSGSLTNTIFLSPTQLTTMTKLGLNFKESSVSNGNTITTPTANNPLAVASVTGAKSTTGTTKTAANGVEIQATQNTPQWLQAILGKNGVANVYVDQKSGDLTFSASTGTSAGMGLYHIGTDSSGLSGAFLQAPNGSLMAMGGDYGFAAGAVQTVMSRALSNNFQMNANLPTLASQVKMAATPTIPQIKVQAPTAPTTVSVAPTPSTTSVSSARAVQPAAPSAKVQPAAGSNSISGGAGGSSSLGGFGGSASLSGGGGFSI